MRLTLESRVWRRLQSEIPQRRVGTWLSQQIAL